MIDHDDNAVVGDTHPDHTTPFITSEGEPLFVDQMSDFEADIVAEPETTGLSMAPPLESTDASVIGEPDDDGQQVHHAKLYDVQHWRTSTARYLDGTTYGYEPSIPPLDKKAFRELPSVTYHAVVGAVAGGLAGERIAFECSAALCSYAPDENSRMFLATQVIDEARHVEVFTHRLKLLGKHDIDDTLHKYVNPRMFQFHRQMRERVCESRDFAGGIVGQNLALEGLALGFFEFNAALLRDIDPGTSHVLDTVLLDERRHVGFGLVRLRELCETEPGRRAYVEDTVGELSGEMMAIFEENADNMASLGLDPSEAMNRVRSYHAMHLRKIGMDDSGI